MNPSIKALQDHVRQQAGGMFKCNRFTMLVSDVPPEIRSSWVETGLFTLAEIVAANIVDFDHGTLTLLPTQTADETSNPTAPKSKGEPVIVQMTNPSDRPAVVRRSFWSGRARGDVESKDAPTEPGFTRAVGVFTSGKEAELLRTLGEQVSGKSLFGFELTAPILEAMTAPDRRLDEDPAPLHAVSHVVGPAIRYYVMVACDRETACRLVQSFWHGIWGSVALRHREISPEAALHRGARVFLERPSGWVDDGTSADPEHRFSFVEDRWALAALLAAMVRDAR